MYRASCLVFFLINFFSFGQSNQQLLDSADYYFQKNRLLDQRKVLLKIDSLELSQESYAFYLFQNGRLNNREGDKTKAFNQLSKSRSIYQELKLPQLEFKVLDELNFCINSTAEYINRSTIYMEELCKLASFLGPEEQAICFHYRMSAAAKDNNVQESIEMARNGLKLSAQHDLSMKQEFVANLGMLYQYTEKKDSALHYLQESASFYQKEGDSSIVSQLYNNIGMFYQGNEDHDNAIIYFTKATNLAKKDQSIGLKQVYALNKAKSYAAIDDFKSASKFYQLNAVLLDSMNKKEYAEKVTEFETKYETTQKEKENLQLKADKEAQRAQIYALSGGAIILLLSGLFLYNNQRKKKLIALKEQEIQKSRANTILKNQELATIDAMISGQEKERKKLAEELHDDLGSTLTTVKLYFENLKTEFHQDKSSEVFNRTEKLLDEAYEKIRSMSHTRNSGVLASKGLIPTLESLAQKVTDSGKINVAVIHHGLDQSLENSLELTIFRILQELLSNIIKHAQASEAVISLTAYEDSINIMVEDNGVGFSITNRTSNGIGLYNIEKRIEQLDGTMEIDSVPEHGTTINLDIPLK